MLKLECINFPITFSSNGNGEVTFNTKDNGVWEDGEVSIIGLDHFIEQHNTKNPENSSKKDYYYYSMGNEQKAHNESNYCKAGSELSHTTKPETKPMIQYAKIENMPIGATLKGVQLDVESWLEITIEPKSMEVCDGMVKLILNHDTIGNKAEGCGISIKIGTLVQYEVK